MYTSAIVLAVAFLADRVLGDPRYALHPVRLIGGLIARLESCVRRLGWDSMFGGGVLLVVSVITVAVSYGAVRIALAAAHAVAPVVLDAFVFYSCIALRDMQRHAVPIAIALKEGDTDRARDLVRDIVGRDVATLDAPGIARAVVESVSESFLDGFLAPLFWFVVGAAVSRLLPLSPLPVATGAALVYRVVNTLDSMVGYRSERYLRLGWASAHADDVLNFIPARMAVPAMVPAAVMCRLNAAAGWRIALRDRLKHASPNSAHPESFAAGALGVRLGGPTAYAHGVVDKPWIGEGTDEVTDSHIVQAARLTACAGWVSALLAVILMVCVVR